MRPVRSKYRAIPTVVDGIRFASKKEANRYQELKLLQKVGEISDLDCQISFLLHVNGVKVGKYVADFTYEMRDGTQVVEDVKGVKTPVYRLKKKLMKALHGIEIQEV